MKYGVNTLLWTASFDESHFDLLPRLKEGGFDGVEIARFSFDGFPAAKIRRELEKNSLGATFCTALTGRQSLISEDEGVRRETIDFLKTAIANTAECGADVLVGPLCSAVGYLPGRRRTQDEWQRGIEGLQALGETCDRYNVSLGVEPLNRFETFFLNTMEDACQLCEAVGHPHVGLMFDTFHANIEEKDLAVAVRCGAKHLKHVHTCENDRGIPGSGHIEWSNVLRALQVLRYDRWMVIESFAGALPELAAAAAIWRDLAPSSDAIAFEGVAFLKQQMAQGAAA